ncbi:MAG: 50S ribosomal protein L13 [candidate division Zixibacteria bacterium 4484_95]|nr:MAG: 50S ribosomal protein L13 [candidate division Zixibacteria bacterium 4484_95]
MKTFVPQPSEHNRKWYLIDASDKVLGRLASEIAKKIRGKDNPLFTPYFDMGASVVVINAEKVRLTGKKKQMKKYYWHTGYPGGLKSESVERMLATHPERVIQNAVKGMLPKNRLGRKLNKRLFIYAGSKHPHQAQMLEPLEI